MVLTQEELACVLTRRDGARRKLVERKGTVPEQAQWGHRSAGVGTRTDAGRWWVWWWHDARPLLLLPTGGQLGMGLKVSGKKGVTPWKWGLGGSHRTKGW